MPNFSEQQLSEWREHPVTAGVLDLQRRLIRARREAVSQAYLSGTDPARLERDRLECLLLQQMVEDWSEATFADIEAMEKQVDEHEWDKTSGI